MATMTRHDFASASVHSRRRKTESSQVNRLLQHISRPSPPSLPKDDIFDPCAEAHLYFYLNRDDVKEALHVDKKRHWESCADVNFSQKVHDRSQKDLYKELIVRAREDGSNLKMMIYSGDDDTVCSTASTQDWGQLGYTKIYIFLVTPELVP
eukprot:CAMPEP_0197259198 /NCGR_PEP_ID=MMETSP1429-20130617/83396_1 /TAXON_ID=49237 /ORGANISM="Chaetoceros  sp., Strain UNC1202" /LENGTH=151 /DNA_ID=CAMNT_0042723401 /DNA_START=97 /DNA_END=552 /DNA_ORIENTATION=-